MKHERVALLAAILVGTGGVGVGGTALTENTHLRHILTARCHEREATYTTTLTNLRADLESLQADVTFFQAQIADITKLGPTYRRVVVNYRGLLAARRVNLEAKQQVILTTEQAPPHCEQISRASG